MIEKLYISDENWFSLEKIGLEAVEQNNVTQIKRKDDKKTFLEVIFCEKDGILLLDEEKSEWVSEVCGLFVSEMDLIVYYRNNNSEEMKQFTVQVKM